MYRAAHPYAPRPSGGYSASVDPPTDRRPYSPAAATEELVPPLVIASTSSRPPPPPGPPTVGGGGGSATVTPSGSTHGCGVSTAGLPETSKPSRPAAGERSGIKRSAKACNHCRKGKARCDGFDSYPCRRCRESGVECIFEGIPVEELLQRSHRMRDEGGGGTPHQEASMTMSTTLESRLRTIEDELDRLHAANRTLEARLDNVSGTRGTARSDTSRSTPAVNNNIGNEALAREAFDLFWQHYAPLAPYISPTEDRYDEVRTRSPLLTHSIIAVASRFQENREFVESSRSEATRLLRGTLFSDTPLTLDDLKGILLFSAWLGRGAPPGHSVSLALQLDLPRSLERLLASIASPPDHAARAFDELMPAVRIWLTLYAQDLWLSFAMGRRSMVTIDLSITNARLLLNFGQVRPVDARLIAQSELVTILGIVQETFLKMQHQTPSQSVEIVTQANGHLSNWIKTWSEWATSQTDSASGRYVLASLTMLLQGGRFYSNTLGLRDITKPEELLPMHMPCLRTALDAAVRIQGIHPAQKIAHAAEFTLITLSTSALFLLKMIKLAPHAFSASYSAPFYPAFTGTGGGATPTSTSTTSPCATVDPSSPDVSAASFEAVHPPSVSQALEAVRHSAGLLASVPPRQRSHHAAVVAALDKLEAELAPAASLDRSSFHHHHPAGAGGSSSNASRVVGTGTGTGKRSREDLGDDDEDGAQEGGGREGGDRARPRAPPATPAAASASASAYDFSTVDVGGADFSSASASAAAAAGVEPLGSAGTEDEFGVDLSIASLVGTQAFWSWESTLPGDINAGLSSVFA